MQPMPCAMPPVEMRDRFNSTSGIHQASHSAFPEPRYVSSQQGASRLVAEQSPPPSYGSAMYQPPHSLPHQPLQLSQSLPLSNHRLPCGPIPAIDTQPKSIISQPEDDSDGQTPDGLYMTAGNRTTSLLRGGFHRQISVDDEGYVPMSLLGPTDQYDKLAPRYVSPSQQSSQMTSRYDRPPLRNFLGQHQSFSDAYLIPVTVTPPRSPRMRHRSLAAVESHLYRLPLRPLAAKQEG